MAICDPSSAEANIPAGNDIFYTTRKYLTRITCSVSARHREGNGFNAWPKPHHSKDVKSCTYYCYVRGVTLIGREGQRGTTQHHAQLELLDKVCEIKGLVVGNDWDLELLDLLNVLALDF